MTTKAKILLYIYGGLFLASIVLCSAPRTSGLANGTFMTFLWAIPFGLYMLPTFIAALKDAPNFAIITAVNICVGWTGVVWLGCLIWAVLDSKPKDPVVIQQIIYQSAPPTPPPLPETTSNPEVTKTRTDQST